MPKLLIRFQNSLRENRFFPKSVISGSLFVLNTSACEQKKYSILEISTANQWRVSSFRRVLRWKQPTRSSSSSTESSTILRQATSRRSSNSSRCKASTRTCTRNTFLTFSSRPTRLVYLFFLFENSNVSFSNMNIYIPMQSRVNR